MIVRILLILMTILSQSLGLASELSKVTAAAKKQPAHGIPAAPKEAPRPAELKSLLEELEGLEATLGSETRGGMVISGGGRADQRTEATLELARKMEAINARAENLRAKVLRLQDTFATRFNDKSDVIVQVETRQDKTKSQMPLGIIELEASLNDVPLVRYQLPLQSEGADVLPVYLGPLPVGEYELRIKTIVGFKQHGWPMALAQGRWQLDKVFKIKAAGTTALVVPTRIVLSPSLSAGGTPELTLEGAAGGSGK